MRCDNGYIWQYKDSDDIENRILLIKAKKKTGVNKKSISCFDLQHNLIQVYESASAAGGRLMWRIVELHMPRAIIPKHIISTGNIIFDFYIYLCYNINKE